MIFDLVRKSMELFGNIVVFPLVFLMLPWILWAASISFLKKVMHRHIKAAGFFLSVSILIYIYALVFGWIMRDGLGPGSVTSHGALMMKRLIFNAAVSALLTTPTSAVFLWLYIAYRRKPE